MPDVVVVGGGIIGTSCAYALSRGGANVTLVEREELAAGASGRNQGWFLVSDDPPLTPMSLSSLAMYRQVIDRSPVPVLFDPDPIGHIMLASSPEGLETLRTRVREREAAGTHAERLDAAGIREIEPALAEDLTEVWLLEQGRRIDPEALTVALAFEARGLGADVRRHTTVRALTTEGSRVTGVVTDDGTLAAGPWSGPFARRIGIDLPVTGARGWIVELSARPGLLRHLIEEEEVGPWDESEAPPTAAELAASTEREPGVSALLHQSHDNAIVCGASHHPALRGEPEDTDAPSRIVRRAVRVVPELADLPVRGIRWGIRPMSPDGRPIIGWLADGLLAATGHGPEGVLLGGGTAELVSSLALAEDPPFDASPFDPFRFG